MTQKRIEELSKRFADVPTAGLLRIVDDAEGIGVLPNCVLVHGDLHLRHVMVDAAGECTGIIDWGDAHIGHPAVDLHAMWSFRPQERQAFLTAYGPVDEPTLRACRLIAVYIGAVLAISAGDFGLPGVETAALTALERACKWAAAKRGASRRRGRRPGLRRSRQLAKVAQPSS